MVCVVPERLAEHVPFDRRPRLAADPGENLVSPGAAPPAPSNLQPTPHVLEASSRRGGHGDHWTTTYPGIGWRGLRFSGYLIPRISFSAKVGPGISDQFSSSNPMIVPLTACGRISSSAAFVGS